MRENAPRILTGYEKLRCSSRLMAFVGNRMPRPFPHGRKASSGRRRRKRALLRRLERFAVEKGNRSGGRGSGRPRRMSLKTTLFRRNDGSAAFEMGQFQKQHALGKLIMTENTRHSARIAENRKARQYYEFLEFFEAGLALTGPEVKSLRAGQVSFGDSFVECRDGEAWIVGMRIAPYERAGYVPQDPDRDRKLLLHAREIKLLAAQTEQKGLTVVPVKLYFKQGNIKMEIALARGRKLHDQREELKRRAETRDLERELARR